MCGKLWATLAHMQLIHSELEDTAVMPYIVTENTDSGKEFSLGFLIEKFGAKRFV